MAVGARFHLVSGRRRDGVCVPGWSDPDPGAPDGPWFAWRLLGGNNRELGRSARVLPSTADCRAAIETVQRRIRDLTPAVLTEPVANRWTWRLDLDGAAVVVASRPYHRQREAQYNLGQFLACAAEAEVGEPGPPGPRTGRPAALRPGSSRGAGRPR
ncbi:MAG TPA: hypothetical protein VFP72_00805 [Kineosporiaceae bacterium]|nr:hypothetical protein [Kineosporiaceae bacterium]